MGHNFAFCFWKYFKKRFCLPNNFTNPSVFWHTAVKGHTQSYVQPKPYLKGIFTCFSFSSSAFSSSDARTIPLSVWFSCKGVGNALNAKRLKTYTQKKVSREGKRINRLTSWTTLTVVTNGTSSNVFTLAGRLFLLLPCRYWLQRKQNKKNLCLPSATWLQTAQWYQNPFISLQSS